MTRARRARFGLRTPHVRLTRCSSSSSASETDASAASAVAASFPLCIRGRALGPERRGATVEKCMARSSAIRHLVLFKFRRRSPHSLPRGRVSHPFLFAAPESVAVANRVAMDVHEESQRGGIPEARASWAARVGLLLLAHD
uniref:Uncharacterized protein n=1 Tax=Mycena chlorophos TaxID=658473 RepID=A0ABQ0L764_MYCCL|nr:predicted protein [Mycena chlorophos]